VKKKSVEESNEGNKSQAGSPGTEPLHFMVASPIVGSGTLIGMSEKGTLPKALPLVDEHQKTGIKLAEIEALLRACNDPAAWPEFAQYCARRRLNTGNELRKRAGTSERRKKTLLKTLRRIEMQLAETEPALAESLKNYKYPHPQVPVSLVPRSAALNSPAALRDQFIASIPKRTPHREICRMLDEQIEEGKLPPDCLRADWMKNPKVRSFADAYKDDKYQPRVRKLISVARKKYGSSYLQR
jgi:hypothetical protein